jgi:hypothetical protein
LLNVSLRPIALKQKKVPLSLSLPFLPKNSIQKVLLFGDNKQKTTTTNASFLTVINLISAIFGVKKRPNLTK